MLSPHFSRRAEARGSKLIRISHRSGAVAQAVQPAVSRVVSTLVDVRGSLLWLETSPRMATQQAGQPSPPAADVAHASGELELAVGVTNAG